MDPRPRRLVRGLGAGVAATIAMSALMMAGMASGTAPMPEPIPLALVHLVLGEGLSRALAMPLGALAHLAYGGLWGAVLAAAFREVSLPKGLALGLLLWLGMQLVVLPVLGWGLFGISVDPRIAVATLVLHLVYGGVLGGLLARRDREGGREVRL